MSRSAKRIIYIAGCGRSGTTILGFAMGAFERAVHLGEILDFAKFQGRPNGFIPGTANYQFWDNVLHDIESTIGVIDFDKLTLLQHELDSHKALLRSSLHTNFERRHSVMQYRAFLAALYGRLLEDDRFDVIIDSSKYPSRLHHLLQLFEDETVCVVHLMRNPIELAKAFRKEEQSDRKSFCEAMLYFFVVNTLIDRVTRQLGDTRYQRVYFEDFIAEPDREIKRIADAFGLNATGLLTMIREHQPLPRGFIFNGNRMRVQESVYLDQCPKIVTARTRVEHAVERAFAAWFISRRVSR